jgi:hypothetical protein
VIESASKAHGGIPIEVAEINIGGTVRRIVLLRFDITEENYEDIVLGDNLIDSSQEHPNTIPTLKRLEEVYTSGLSEYTLEDDLV